MATLEASQQRKEQHSLEKDVAVATDSEKQQEQYDSAELQAGVRRAEDVRESMTRRDRLLLLLCIWLMTFVMGLSVQTMYPLLPYVYSAFQAHSLIPTTFIVSSVVGAVIRLPLAKILDLWGRAQGLALMIGLFTIGCITMAACQNVFTYAAASVFYFTGYDGFSYVVFVIIADHWNLKDRGLIFGFYQTPWIATTYIGPVLAERFLTFSTGWRWSFGVFAITSPVAGLILVSFLLGKQKKGQGHSSLPGRPSLSFYALVKFYLVQMDALGLVLLAAGFSLFLLPFSLYTTAGKGFGSTSIIVMLVIGVVLLIVFGLWEKLLAPVSFIPFSLLKDRTVLGASLTYATSYLIYQVWSTYFSSSLQVVQGLSVTQAGYVYNIHSVGWCIASFVGGTFIKFTGRYKGIALYFSLPLQVLGTGLMIYFSRTATAPGLIIMSQIFIAIADGLLYITSDVAVLSTCKHEHIAVVLAIYNLIGNSFQAIGSTISAALWTSLFPEALARNLPTGALQNLTSIYADIITQLSYPPSSDERRAIQLSYEETVSKQFITATALTSIGLVGILLWRKKQL